jgi:anti-anti-sigma factor
MNITAQTTGLGTTLHLEGNFVYTERKVFQEAIRKACEEGARSLVIDLSEVVCLDSAALGLLMVTHRQLCKEHRRLAFARPRANVRQVIQLANLLEIIPIVDGGDLSPAQESA